MKKTNKQLKVLISNQNELLRRMDMLEHSFKLKDKDDEKYKNKVDDLNDFMNQMKGRIEQATYTGSDGKVKDCPSLLSSKNNK